jgi:Uma2 family endonuclease
MAERKTLLTGDDLLMMLSEGRRYELRDGELVEMAPANGRHGRTEGRIGHELIMYVNTHDVMAAW